MLTFFPEFEFKTIINAMFTENMSDICNRMPSDMLLLSLPLQTCCWACPVTVRAATGPWRDQRSFSQVMGLSHAPSWISEGPVTLASPRPSLVTTSSPMTSSSPALVLRMMMMRRMIKHSPHVYWSLGQTWEASPPWWDRWVNLHGVLTS